MKSLIAALIIAFSTGIVSADDGHDRGAGEPEGGTGWTEHNDYYNPDLKCSIMDGVTAYINMKPTLRLSISAYHPSANKVYSRNMHLEFDHQDGDSHFYKIETHHACAHALYLEMGYGAKIWDDEGNVISTCVPMTLPGGRSGPTYP